jgi:putative Mg2+ transporter-C (MgtC) family protein
MDILTENLIKLGMAVLVGGIIGAEREFRDKAAGFRTIILITVGSVLFTIFSMSMDPGFTRTRVAANIVTGIGFLGAGAIIREHGHWRRRVSICRCFNLHNYYCLAGVSTVGNLDRSHS